MSETKHCNGCNQDLALDAFSKKSSRCRECKKAYKKDWNERNQEHVQAYTAQRYQEVEKANNAARYTKYREAYLTRRKVYHEQNRERDQATSKQWKERNIAHVHQYDRDRYTATRSEAAKRNKEWRRTHPLQRMETEARRRARLAGVHVVKVDYAAIVARDHSCCHICKRSVATPDLSFDHVVPISRGGAHDPSNIHVAHRSCNSRKGNRVTL